MSSFVTPEMVTNSFTGTFTNKYIKLDDGTIQEKTQGVDVVANGTHIKIDNLFSDGLFKMNSDEKVTDVTTIKTAISADNTLSTDQFNEVLKTLKTKQTDAALKTVQDAEEAQKAAAQNAAEAQKAAAQNAAAQNAAAQAQTTALKQAVTDLMPSVNKDKVLYAGLCFPVGDDKTKMKAVKRTIVLLKLLISANYSNSEDIDKLLDRAGIMQLIMIKELELGVVPTGNSAGLLALKAQVKLMLDKQYNSVFATTGWSRPEILKTEMAEVGKKYNKYKSKYLALKNQ